MNSKFNNIYFRKKESGVILVFSIIFLLVLLILAGSSVSTVILEERMAGNLRNKMASFQAAEAALAQAENYLNKEENIESKNGIYIFGDSRKPSGDPGQAGYWKNNFTWTAHNPHYTGDTAELIEVNIFGRNFKAYYVIEELPEPTNAPNASEAYRITSYSPGAGFDSETYLQGYYTR